MSQLKSLDLIKNLDKETFNRFINQIINNLNNYFQNSNYDDFNFLKTNNDDINLKEIINEWSIYLVKIYDLENKTELPLIDDLNDDKKDELINILKQKNQLIKQFLFYMALRKDYPNLLNEFDWNINLVLATDQISNLNKLVSNIQFNNSNNDKICNLELNEDELDQLIESIDKIKDELKNLIVN